jgi:hypothetical protein
LDELLERVKQLPRAKEIKLKGKNLAYLLVDFLDEQFMKMSCWGWLMDTRKARDHSEML